MSLPPITERTAQAIIAALEHQYGVPMAAVLISVPRSSVERAELILAGKPADAQPVIGIANINLPDHVALPVLANALEASSRIAEQAKSLEATKGNA